MVIRLHIVLLCIFVALFSIRVELTAISSSRKDYWEYFFSYVFDVFVFVCGVEYGDCCFSSDADDIPSFFGSGNDVPEVAMFGVVVEELGV